MILKGSSKGGPDPFCEKTINVLLKWTLFLAGPHIQAIQISCQLSSNVDIKDSWAHQILLRPIKISNGPLKFGNLHVFEWDMSHRPILRAHHHFGLGLTLYTQIAILPKESNVSR